MASQASSFSLSVDRPDDGPLVISVRGALALPTNARLLADCLTAVGAADRPTIVDLTDVPGMGSVAVDILVNAARRLSSRGFRLTVVTSPTAGDGDTRVLAEHVHVERADGSNRNFGRSATRTVAVDALHGTYL